MRELSSPPEKTLDPFGEIAKQRTVSECSFNTETISPSLVHTQMERSLEPLSRYFPSWVNKRHHTHELCPWRIFTWDPVEIEYIIILMLSYPTTNYFSS